MSRTFSQRLRACQQVGNLTIADLSRWFDRPYQTVRCWVERRERNPGGGFLDKQHAEMWLAKMERLIRLKRIPVPRDGRLRRLAVLRAKRV